MVAKIPVCLHALQSISLCYVALIWGIELKELGLVEPEGDAIGQCLDPHLITGRRTVTFRIKMA